MNNITIQKLVDEVIRFRDERNWKKFHNPKDVTIAMQLEVAEIFEHLKWKTNKEFREYLKRYRKEVTEEVMDVLYHVLLLIDSFKINVDKEFFAKMVKNRKKYPAEIYKGKHSFQVQIEKKNKI